MKKYFFLLLIISTFTLSCSTGPSSGTAGTATANVATGAVDVDVDQSFTVTFSAAVKTATVTTDSFFVVPVVDPDASIIKFAAFDSSVCNPDNAIEGTITCVTTTSCSLTPEEELDADAEYAICLTSDIQFEDTDTYGYFEGLTESFTTEASGGDDSDDTTSPTAGGSGVISTASITASSLTLSWTKAGDDVSSQTALQYQVYSSTSDNIDSVDDVQDNGSVIKTWTTDINSFNVTGLNESTTYYFNVLVKDEAGNISAYTAKNATTLDGTAPTPGSSGTITTDAVTSLTLTLNWTKATDSATDQADLLYKVVKSSSNNISTVTTAEANGTVISSDWEQDIATLDVTSLLPSTTYYFNVLVKDESGNKAAYSTVTETTEDAIVMFGTDAYDGDILTAGGKATARLSGDFICSTKKDAEYPDLGCDTTMAFLTFSGTDEVRDMPVNYDTPEDQPIVGPTGIKIADDWADLLDGSIDNTLQDAGAIAVIYKTGTHWDGSLDGGGNCVGYTSNDPGDGTELGYATSTGNSWLAAGWANICSEERAFLCICWTGL